MIPAAWINFAGNLWAIIFAASFVLTFVDYGTQTFRGKSFADSPLIPVHIGLHVLWALPLILPVLAVWGVFSAVFWLFGLRYAK
jgi:hypothetical protein